jgi:hypothetical protein
MNGSNSIRTASITPSRIFGAGSTLSIANLIISLQPAAQLLKSDKKM